MEFRRHKGWFAVPDKRLSSEVVRILEMPFPTKKILVLQGVILKVIVTPRVHYEKHATTWLLLTEAVTSLYF